MSTLTDNATGDILIDGVADLIKPMTPEEDALYQDLEFDCDSFRNIAGKSTIQWYLNLTLTLTLNLAY